MITSKKIVLRLPLSDGARLDIFVEECLSEGVELVAVWGDRSAQVEDAIDELVVGDGSDPSRFLVTTAHPPEKDAIAFAKSFNDGAEPTVLIL